MTYSYQGREFQFQRYPVSGNRSLRPISAADELLLDFYQENSAQNLLIQHDRFGVIASCLHSAQPFFVGSFASQQKALGLNLAQNQLAESPVRMISPLDQAPELTELTILRLPKSLDLFELYLDQAVRSSAAGAKIVVGFMTRYFTPAILEIAEKYATTIAQSKAKKKARLLILEGLRPQSSKADAESNAPFAPHLLKHIAFEDESLQQYYGVFSGNHIDYATQFLLPFLTPTQTGFAQNTEVDMLDIGCGNGIIGHHLLKQYPESKLTVTDDAALAIASAKLNLDPSRTTFLYTDALDELADASQDLIVTNPPFHFGHENNIEVSLSLFKQVKRVLKPGGTFYVVANRHLNYRTHLEPLFGRVVTKGENDKFVVYACLAT